MNRIGKAAKNPVRKQLTPSIKEPTKIMSNDTVFDHDRNYAVKLNGIADYLGVKLTPMFLHVVSGTVAESIRNKIAKFDLA